MEEFPFIPYDNLSRRDKRVIVFYLLYAMESFDYQTSLEAIVDNINRGYNLDIPSGSQEVQAAAAIIKDREELDKLYIPYLANWRLERLGVCTKLILRYGTWELVYSDTEPTIAINEAVELAKCFAEQEAYKFVNGVLDEILKKYKKATPPPA